MSLLLLGMYYPQLGGLESYAAMSGQQETMQTDMEEFRVSGWVGE